MSKKQKPASATPKRDPKSDASAKKTLNSLQTRVAADLQKWAQAVQKLNDQDPTLAEKLLQTAIQSSQLQKLAKQTKGPLDAECLAAIFRELASGARASLRDVQVAFLGPLHSYSHLATLEHFGHSAKLIAVGSIAAVFEEVSSGHCEAGVVPIENSTDGRIVDTLGMFTKTSVKICGDIPLPIHHNLLGIGARAEVTQVCSKPQAISQCRDWLAEHVPKAKLTSMTSTTAAAQLAAKDRTVAAIASHQAGVEYGLKVLAKDIEDNKGNVTRFAVIGLEPAQRTGNDKTALMFEVCHEPGALADAMVIFKRNRLNLTWIESFPKPGSPSEYLFFVELAGYQTDLKVRQALAALEKKSVSIVILGSYAK